MKFLHQGFDHIEFTVGDIQKHQTMWSKMGFEKVGESTDVYPGSKSVLMAQGLARLLLVQYDQSAAARSELGQQFWTKHGDGVSVLAVEVDDAVGAFNETVSRGARPALKPFVTETADGVVCIAEIYTPEDLRYRFVQRKYADKNQKALFLKGLNADRMQSPSPCGILLVDHLTNNINIGEFNKWTRYYQDVFQFKVIRHFNIKTGRTGLNSDAVQSECGRITVPINEATEPESQVQEFVNRFNGAGVQHLAFLVTDIISNLKDYRKEGFKFLSVPHTYYEEVPTRVPGVTEDLKVLEELGILLDSEGPGYLMQIFTEELIGPFFVEIIQRKGNKGFGEGNFRALFEAIERDQIKRGVLKA